MMYFLLVEAAGIRQLERIHADRYRTIVSELEGTLDRFGFGEITRDGDLLLYGARPEIKLEPPVIAALGRTVLSALRGRMEDLLDFLIVIDYRDGAVPPGLLVKMERLLRFARSSNAVYATEPVVQAISPMVETVPEGELNRIVAFLGEGTGRDVSYRDELLQPELAGRIVERMRSHRAAHIWIVAPDTSIAAVSLESAVSELAPAARQIVIQCRPESTSEEILQGIVAGLPGEGGGVRESRGAKALRTTPPGRSRSSRSASRTRRRTSSRRAGGSVSCPLSLRATSTAPPPGPIRVSLSCEISIVPGRLSSVPSSHPSMFPERNRWTAICGSS
jgi:hypothetical protein